MTATPSWAAADGDRDDWLNRLLAPDCGPFALLRRTSPAPVANPLAADRIDLLLGEVSEVGRVTDLPLPEAAGPGAGHDLLAVLPFRQLSERGLACHDDGEPILALSVREQVSVPVGEALNRIGEVPIPLHSGDFDLDDAAYAETVRRILAEEIGCGEGANFVIKRSFTATVPGWSPAMALAVFRRLLLAEPGAYWIFLVHTGSRTFLGASPERQVSLSGGTVVMNPISGTYRYPPEGPTVSGALEFLTDPKETDELYMVVDEELKMMARLCDGGIRVIGPCLKEMARLAHTEYFIEGHGIAGHSARDARVILRDTMFAPTVTGSPLENACRVIARHEPGGRGYYGGALALLGHDECGRQELDSAILIRTAEFDDAGRMRLGTGATLVRESVPESEAAETRAKAAAMLAALRGPGVAAVRPTPVPRTLGPHPAVAAALAQRNTGLSRYWLGIGGGQRSSLPGLLGRKVLVVDAEDTFTAMLDRMLGALGLSVTVARFSDAVVPTDHQFVVIGPGPGDPRAHADPKIAALRTLTREVLDTGVPLLSICLGHQVLAGLLGFSLVRKEFPNQGVRREIDLFGRVERVGFYNSFTAVATEDRVHSPGVAGPIEVSRDPACGDVHALRGPGFSSVQFHPESVLTGNGPAIIGGLLESLRGTHE